MWKSVETFCPRWSNWHPVGSSPLRQQPTSRSLSKTCWWLLPPHSFHHFLALTLMTLDLCPYFFVAFVFLLQLVLPLFSPHVHLSFLLLRKEAKIEPEDFTSRLYKELNSSPQPYLVPFLKVRSVTRSQICKFCMLNSDLPFFHQPVQVRAACIRIFSLCLMRKQDFDPLQWWFNVLVLGLYS